MDQKIRNMTCLKRLTQIKEQVVTAGAMINNYKTYQEKTCFNS